SMEDEMNCSICQELFKDPVTLRCGHNFCRECVCEYWKEKTSQSCPICRADSAITDLITNHTLRNIIETYKKEGKKSKIQSKFVCSQHREELKLYCLEDQKAICLVCQTSRKHENHKFLPIEEAAQEFKSIVKLSIIWMVTTCLHSLRKHTKRCYDRVIKKHIMNEVRIPQKQVSSLYHLLHIFLETEKNGNQNTDLRIEREERWNLFPQLSDILLMCLLIMSSKTIVSNNDLVLINKQIFLFHFSLIKKYADYKPREPEAISAADIDGYKYTDRLQYRVWKKMLKIIDRVTVTLDPNTAHPRLALSEDLNAVTRGETRRDDLPDNPERFDVSPCILGSEGFTSGRHSWVVDVENQISCYLGVAAESANRKGFIDLNLKPELGYWTVQLFCGVYAAFTDEGWTQLKVLKTPKKLLISMNYEAGKVLFSNADDMSHIYTFTHKFKHKIFPFFCLRTERAPLRICNL
uniref:Tripartite motif containing 35 n=1 Tax=Latimeria chalumnae TaxID=7897 RepID=H3B2T0_LATCH